MRIATYNIKSLYDAGTYTNFLKTMIFTPEFVQKRVEYIAGVLKKLDADVVLVQEIASKEVLEKAAQLADPSYRVFVAEPDYRGIANAVIYRVDAEVSSASSLGTLPIFKEGDEDIYTKRLDNNRVRSNVILKAKYNDKDLTLVGVHFKSPLPMQIMDKKGEYIQPKTQLEAADAAIRGSLYRAAQAKKLRELVDFLQEKDPEAQIAILGDYNAKETDDTVTILQGRLKNSTGILENLCLRIPTEKRFSILNKKRGPALFDQILVTESLASKFKSITVFNEDIFEQEVETEHEFIESDHAPVVVELV